jgi:hypothetical protein
LGFCIDKLADMENKPVIQGQIIENKIYEIRGRKIMFDFDLAELYEVENRVLKQAVKRNIEVFPSDFMFALTKTEWQELITICDKFPENLKHSPVPPFAFTDTVNDTVNLHIKTFEDNIKKYNPL